MLRLETLQLYLHSPSTWTLYPIIQLCSLIFKVHHRVVLLISTPTAQLKFLGPFLNCWNCWLLLLLSPLYFKSPFIKKKITSQRNSKNSHYKNHQQKGQSEGKFKRRSMSQKQKMKITLCASLGEEGGSKFSPEPSHPTVWNHSAPSLYLILSLSKPSPVSHTGFLPCSNCPKASVGLLPHFLLSDTPSLIIPICHS